MPRMGLEPWHLLIRDCRICTVSKAWNKESKKSSVFWAITLCRPFRFNWLFGGTWCLHLDSRRIFQAWNHGGGGRKYTSDCYLFLRNAEWHFNELHSVISQKIELFIITAVRTSGPINRLFKIWDLHSDECPQCGLPDCDTVLSSRCIPSFRGMLLALFSFKVDAKHGNGVFVRNIVSQL
jgi:hypothetical protein